MVKESVGLISFLFWTAILALAVVVAILLSPIILGLWLLARMDPRWGHEGDGTEPDVMK